MQSEINVSNPERWLSVVGGAAIAAYGLKMRSLSGLVLLAAGGALVWRGATGHCAIYDSLGFSTADEKERNVSVPYGKGFAVEKSVTINATPEELYQFWRQLENLPRFMKHLESITVRDDKRSHWVVKGPAGIDVEWDAEIINEVPNERIGWRSVDGANVDNAGSVHFKPAPGGRGTEVRVVLRYDPPAGAAGKAFATLFGENPEHQVDEDLHRLKQLIEGVEIAAATGQPSGKAAR